FVDRISRLVDEYGGVVRIHLFSNRYILISHPKYIEPVVSSTEMIVKGTSYRFVRPWLGQGLLTSSESIMGVSVNAQKDSESNYVKAIEE
ncbi:Cytochrome P450 CYP4L6, partial [Operophtera brumata]